jgi:hypothetical protein
MSVRTGSGKRKHERNAKNRRRSFRRHFHRGEDFLFPVPGEIVCGCRDPRFSLDPFERAIHERTGHAMKNPFSKKMKFPNFLRAIAGRKRKIETFHKHGSSMILSMREVRTGKFRKK